MKQEHKVIIKHNFLRLSFDFGSVIEFIRNSKIWKKGIEWNKYILHVIDACENS